ncbi:Acetyl-CoA synthetase (Acetate-CoA ligase) [Desulfatibacillum aliphaticivorans]|uniref:Acetyl-coenzyme A synthetase n=1 Tax=Desulfatibacillum aliphaticivorans TaxID=218208 RepID=ACSA_DESAL|nr:acetate--CoA ligase [Desulfatibacillum aliphaticivorans]B8FIN2.1 RecName: Full=Acetyl-coenzyme A synthetase; Short=AcCoA synthetase; Short=Acs; AltName: Full=Acetate--CoA ligase; AltName: Full=Acyl-activating enzyme [Desulfatibacillum aliphaticivorans]ACL04022.1 Acetyl-CoA synthetase (Acetate-CoA ligase) [Desulfatibacillum aliphaticivorans]
MSNNLFTVPEDWQKRAWCDDARYQKMYDESVNDPDAFWSREAQRIDWFEPFSKVKNSSFNGDVDIKWFLDGKLNVAYNCLDRHLEKRGDQTAIIFEGNEPGVEEKITYRQLYERVCRFSNVLKSCGVKKGDRVSIYLPMIPQLAVAMLACARIGAIHSIVFAGFSPDALANRITDAECTILITADEGLRGPKAIGLKEAADEAMDKAGMVKKCIVVKHTGADVPMKAGRDLWWHELTAKESTECPPESMDSEDPLFILYTSGSTGTPKGVLHTTGGYIVYTSLTHQYVFDYHDGDIYWCTADIGWVTGHSYIIYGPLANGAVTIMFEGIPNYPDFSRFWQICDKHQVNIFYTAPTVVRALMQQGDEPVKATSRTSVRLLGTVGEPINPEAWLWYHRVVGEERCPIVDTWWQTETGGIMITPLPGATALKPGSATRPFFGIQPALIDKEGNQLEGPGEGYLVMLDSWPALARTVYGDHRRFKSTYFIQCPGTYFSGDGARRDEDGYYWITGRIDDVINVSGHRLGTAEIESSLVAHPAVSEAAVVGFPHDIKGQAIYAYVTLSSGYEPSEELRKELSLFVRKDIGPIATPEVLQFTDSLPKTRSGKIMRRILRKVACNELDNLGDTSTLADPAVVEALIKNRIDACR